MIKIFVGENEFAIKKSIQKIKNQFIEKTGTDFGISKTTAKDGFEKAKNLLKSNSFFSQFKLVFIEDFLDLVSSDQKKLIKLLEGIDKKTIVVLTYCRKPDLRKLKSWSNKFKITDYSNQFSIDRFISQKIISEEVKINSDAKRKFLELVGQDFFRAENELNKLIAYKNNNTIEISDVENIVTAEINSSVFNLIDAIGQKDISKSLSELNKLLQNSENEIYILTMIVYAFRNIILIKHLWLKGNRQGEIAQKLKMHPFVVSKTLGHINKFSFQSLISIYSKLLDADFSMKTGRRDPKMILEMLVSFLSR
jgi:DNA polymerase-3 subunit delta